MREDVPCADLRSHQSIQLGFVNVHDSSRTRKRMLYSERWSLCSSYAILRAQIINLKAQDL